MIRTIVASALMTLALGAAAASAQNLTLRAPAWAQPLLATDVTPTTGGRVALAADGVDFAARVTIAPNQGGVARVIRFEARSDANLLALRRFTGHPSTGWWMWGPDTPIVTHPSAAVRQQLAPLVQAALGVAGSLGDAGQPCANGEQAYIEVSQGGRALSATRVCVGQDDAMGRLALRLSELAGSRTDEDLRDAAVNELLAADRAFAAMAASDGVPAAFMHYSAPDAILVGSGEPAVGQDAIRASYANWPRGARLEWAPVAARVSERGDMGWTWGRSTYVAPDGTRRVGRYVTTWTRDYDGNWRFAFDGALRDAAAAPARATQPH